ncbi:winged helix-turn-helix transcriptional regulator [Syntrophomonas curvata]
MYTIYGREWENLLFNLGLKQKTVKELRKNQGMTARDLAQRLNLNTAAIARIDDMKLREVPEPLRSKITPILRGDDLDKIPWL